MAQMSTFPVKTCIWLLINAIQYKPKVVAAALAKSAAVKTMCTI